jgi:hypothetical protein
VGRAGQVPWLYARDAVYRLNPETTRAELVMPLPRAITGLAAHGDGDALALPDGGLLLAHHDLDDRRLLRLDASGRLLWERSYREAGDGPSVLASDGQATYLALVDEGATTLVAVFAVDLESGNLTRLLEGGTRTGVPGNTWMLATPSGTLLVNIGGGHLVALDPRAAAQAVAPAP